MAADWTLEKELCKLANVGDFYEALYSLGIIKERNQKINLIQSHSWERGGAETYIYKFWLQQDNKISTGYILKACVAFSPASSLETILKEWIERRSLIEANGILTPRLFAAGHGVILEELIPFELKTRIIEAGEQMPVVLHQVAGVLGILSKLGFNTASVLDDLRTRGDDVVMIDFGEDLGPPIIGQQNIDQVTNHLINKVRQWGVLLPDSLADDIKSTVLLMSDKDAEKMYVM